MSDQTTGTVVSVSASPGYTFSKPARDHIMLLAGLGVEGDAHMGKTVKHRHRVAQDPTQPNLRQVHLIHEELLDELLSRGFRVAPGDMGENITTRHVDLLGLPAGALLRIGGQAVIEVTGLRNPCYQLDDFEQGLMNAVTGRDGGGNPAFKAGVMGIVKEGGPVAPGDQISIVLPAEPHRKLEIV